MLKIGEREFDVIQEGTMEWDVTLLGLLIGCGLADVTLHQGETPQMLAERITKTLWSSGAVFEILGCVLTKAGSGPLDWNPEAMRASADFFRKLNSKEDKAALKGTLVELVIGFFQQGLLSIRTFPTSSSATTETQPSPKPEGISINGLGRGP
jgi:hypothetical protein